MISTRREMASTIVSAMVAHEQVYLAASMERMLMSPGGQLVSEEEWEQMRTIRLALVKLKQSLDCPKAR